MSASIEKGYKMGTKQQRRKVGRPKKFNASIVRAAIKVLTEAGRADGHRLSSDQQTRLDWYKKALVERLELKGENDKKAKKRKREIKRLTESYLVRDFCNPKYPQLGKAFKIEVETMERKRRIERGTQTVPIKIKIITKERLQLLGRCLRVSSPAKAIDHLLGWVENGGESELSGIAVHKFKVGCKKLREKYPRAYKGAQ